MYLADTMYLWYGVIFQHCVLAGLVGHIQGQYVAQSLDFMDDCICIGHIFSVLHRGQTR